MQNPRGVPPGEKGSNFRSEVNHRRGRRRNYFSDISPEAIRSSKVRVEKKRQAVTKTPRESSTIILRPEEKKKSKNEAKET